MSIVHKILGLKGFLTVVLVIVAYFLLSGHFTSVIDYADGLVNNDPIRPNGATYYCGVRVDGRLSGNTLYGEYIDSLSLGDLDCSLYRTPSLAWYDYVLPGGDDDVVCSVSVDGSYFGEQSEKHSISALGYFTYRFNLVNVYSGHHEVMVQCIGENGQVSKAYSLNV